MKLMVWLLSTLIIAQAGTIKDVDVSSVCEGIEINGVYYQRDVLKEDLDRPYLLATDLNSNIIYFSYSVNGEEDVFKTAILNLNTKEFADIEGINNGFAQTVDQVNHVVYIGGSDGIYQYDPKENKAEYIGEKDSNIWTLFFKDVLYYSEFPSQFLYTFVNGQSTKFNDLEDTKVDNFIIDNDNNMFYTNATGLFSQKKGTKDAVLYKEFQSGVRGLALDTKGNVYLCHQDGIYSINKSSTSLVKLVDIEDAFGITFDNKDNIIYADATNLVRLKPNKNS